MQKGARNILMLPKRAPVAGTGWGCVVCGLPNDGAVSVLCDACMEEKAQPKFVIIGYLGNNQRTLMNTLTDEVFDHDEAKHSADDYA